MTHPQPPIQTDALIIGAGPAGLFQAFQLGLHEINCHIVDALPYPGGQCIELYADKPIYDIPGLPRCTGRSLVANLLEQVQPFKPVMHLGQLVTGLEPQANGRFEVTTSTGMRFDTRCVFIAAGVGAFQPRLLAVEGIDQFHGRQLLYRIDKPADFAGQHVLVVGGDDAALDGAAQLAAADPQARPASVTLLHRRDVYQALPEAIERVKALSADGQLRLLVGQVTGYAEAAGQMTAVQITGADGTAQPYALDRLIVLLGLSPKLGPIAEWGLAMARKQLPVDTEQFSTAVSGVFAVGDINTYPGKKKLILSAFHECALAAFGAAALVFPDKKIMLQYTTTSTRLHALLGVGGGVSTPS